MYHGDRFYSIIMENGGELLTVERQCRHIQLRTKYDQRFARQEPPVKISMGKRHAISRNDQFGIFEIRFDKKQVPGLIFIIFD